MTIRIPKFIIYTLVVLAIALLGVYLLNNRHYPLQVEKTDSTASAELYKYQTDNFEFLFPTKIKCKHKCPPSLEGERFVGFYTDGNHQILLGKNTGGTGILPLRHLIQEESKGFRQTILDSILSKYPNFDTKSIDFSKIEISRPVVEDDPRTLHQEKGDEGRYSVSYDSLHVNIEMDNSARTKLQWLYEYHYSVDTIQNYTRRIYYNDQGGQCILSNPHDTFVFSFKSNPYYFDGVLRGKENSLEILKSFKLKPANFK